MAVSNQKSIWAVDDTFPKIKVLEDEFVMRIRSEGSVEEIRLGKTIPEDVAPVIP
jgi:hypothetical protein